MGYTASDDYCEKAQKWQSVPSADEARAQLDEKGKDSSDPAVKDYREGTKYSCDDSYQMGTIQDGRIYVSTTDNQHQQIMNGEPPTADGGVSGYFTDQATVDHCSSSGVLDNGQLNRELQVAPYQADASSDPAYKPHTDCFKINEDKLEEHYGTRDFNAALAKCEANNQFGEGGGNQGFNPHISEMMSNGCLEHDKANSYSDASVSKLDSSLLNDKQMTNSTVSQDTYDNMMQDAKDRSQDCVKNNTAHPSPDVVNDTGYAHNPNPVEGVTGNATPIKASPSQENESSPPGTDKTGKGGMPTTAASTDPTVKSSADGMSTTAVGKAPSGESDTKGPSAGMSTTNVGGSGGEDGKSGMPTTLDGKSGAPSTSTDLSKGPDGPSL